MRRRDNLKTRSAPLSSIRRFLLHILPAGFVRIRHFGFLANRARRDKLRLCRALLGAPSAPPLTDAIVRKMDEKLCPVCATGHMRLIRLSFTEWPAALLTRIDSS